MKTSTNVCNTVADDLIWKDQIKKEFKASDQWQPKWGFLAAFMGKEQLESVSLPSKSGGKESKGNPIRLPVIDTSNNKPFRNSKPFPQTTAQFIGWKSQYPENRLDKYGPYTKPLTTFFQELY